MAILSKSGTGLVLGHLTHLLTFRTLCLHSASPQRVIGGSSLCRLRVEQPQIVQFAKSLWDRALSSSELNVRTAVIGLKITTRSIQWMINSYEVGLGIVPRRH